MVLPYFYYFYKNNWNEVTRTFRYPVSSFQNKTIHPLHSCSFIAALKQYIWLWAVFQMRTGSAVRLAWVERVGCRPSMCVVFVSHLNHNTSIWGKAVVFDCFAPPILAALQSEFTLQDELYLKGCIIGQTWFGEFVGRPSWAPSEERHPGWVPYNWLMSILF